MLYLARNHHHSYAALVNGIRKQRRWLFATLAWQASATLGRCSNAKLLHPKSKSLNNQSRHWLDMVKEATSLLKQPPVLSSCFLIEGAEFNWRKESRVRQYLQIQTNSDSAVHTYNVIQFAEGRRMQTHTHNHTQRVDERWEGTSGEWKEERIASRLCRQ